MINSRTYFIAALVISSVLSHAQSASPNGMISGSADPGAQIVVTGTDDGSVTGLMAACDGTYKTSGLKPGRYSIVEGGPHHAVRTLSVEAGAVSHVDLGSPDAASTRACNDKAKTR